MKRAAMVVMMLALATFVFAQYQTPAPQNQPASQPGAAKSGAAQQNAAPAAAPQGKRPPQAKTQPEFDAYKAAISMANDPAALEKAVDDFAAKFPDSELRVLLYRTAMHSYQSANNADKMLEMGQSKPWQDAMQELTGQRQADASAIIEYFAPLKKWLDEQNKGMKAGW